MVVGPGGAVPEAWRSCLTVTVGPADLEQPGPVTEVLHRAWLDRRPVVVELAADPAALRRPEHHEGPVYRLGPEFEFTRERLQFLVWANTYDVRSAAPVWWHGRRAARRLAGQGVTEGGPADVVGPDGRPWYVDGGPPDPPRLDPEVAVAHRWTVEAGGLRPTGHRDPDAELAPDQRAAVAHRSGPARVIAPAGSGKTRVLTERLRHLVAERGAHPATVTALAYNTRAADEMRARCRECSAPTGRTSGPSTASGCGSATSWAPTAGAGSSEESAVRDLLGRLFEVRRQANTDTLAPLHRGPVGDPAGPGRAGGGRRAIPDAAGLADGFDRYRRPWPRPGPSTSTSRSTGPSRSCWPTPRPGAGPRPGAVDCWSTSSRI